MNIADAASLSRCSAKTMRCDEEIESITALRCGDNRYRRYGAWTVQELHGLVCARDVGLELPECWPLASLQCNDYRSSRHALASVLKNSAQLQARIDQLRSMQRVRQNMPGRCHGEEGPKGAIFEDFAGRRFKECA